MRLLSWLLPQVSKQKEAIQDRNQGEMTTEEASAKQKDFSHPEVSDGSQAGQDLVTTSPDLERAAQQLNSEDCDIRLKAALELAENRDVRALDMLVVALRDKDKNVQEEAARALGKIRDSRAVEPLIAAVKGASKDIRKAAAYALGQIKDPRAVEPLVAALNSRHVEREAAEALVSIGNPAVDFLTAALKEKNRDVRKTAAEVLGSIGDPRAIEPLVAALDGADVDFCNTAAQALKSLGAPESVQILARQVIENLKSRYVPTDQMQRFDLRSVTAALNNLPTVSTFYWIRVNGNTYGPVNPSNWPSTDQTFDNIEDCIGELKSEAGKEDVEVLWATTNNALIVEVHYKSKSDSKHVLTTLTNRRVILKNIAGKFYRLFTWIA